MRKQWRFGMTQWISFLVLVFIVSSCGDAQEDPGPSAAGQTTGRIIPVTLARAVAGEVRDEFFTVGRIVSKNTPVLAAEINARVVEVLAEEGQTVERGQVLMLLDKTTFELARREAQAAIQQLTVSIANEERRVSRYRDLKTKDVMPQERLDDAEAKLAVDKASFSAAEARLAITEDRLAKTELVSPVNGVVERRHVSVGDYVQVGGALLTVTDTVNLRVELPFPEPIGHRLKTGQLMHLESPIAPGLVVKANVGLIRPQVGAMNRSVMVITDIVNPGSWRPQATVEATLVAEVRSSAIVVPVSSVVKRPAGNVVYLADSPAGDRVRQLVVSPGVRMNGWIEIREGLSPGDLIVVEGAHYLSDGAQVLVKESAP